jgi:hypothetical protein
MGTVQQRLRSALCKKKKLHSKKQSGRSVVRRSWVVLRGIISITWVEHMWECGFMSKSQ